MTSYNFGDVVLVPFPFTDQSTIKKRPAVVISKASYAKDHPDLILMALTSQVAERETNLVTFWKEAGLLKPTAIKPVITSLEAGLVLAKLGSFKQVDLDLLKSIIQNLIG